MGFARSQTSVAITTTESVVDPVHNVDVAVTWLRTGQLDATGARVEMTPQELARQLDLNTNINEKLGALETACGPGLREMSSQLRLMLPGPEWAFQRSNPEVVIQATEDQVLKDLNALDFEGKDNFDFDNPAITEDALKAIETIRNDILALTSPSDDTIQRAVSFEQDSVRRAKLKSALRKSIARGTRIIRGAYKRNEAIAASILSARGNMAVPIGFRHVDHLVGEILRQCRAVQP